ncbi:MAG: hypothetical protein BWY28_02913 [bacterium ADurb.Bin236]|nr:MAG: hypothetical protein BWY28_02913 [bacterium ADurb.Bin236]
MVMSAKLKNGCCKKNCDDIYFAGQVCEINHKSSRAARAND